MTKRTVFFLSDHTGITIEQVGHSLMSQFESLDFNRIRFPFINSLEKAQQARDLVQQDFIHTTLKPLVFSSITDVKLRNVIEQSECLFFDFFAAFISPMEKEFGISASLTKGLTHGLVNQETYHTRIHAVDFSVNNDDGANVRHYDNADLIIIGVSRSGKTPTSLYMALQFGINAANYPLTDSDLDSPKLPKALQPFRSKVFGLTIDADHLQMIRQERLPDSRYATVAQCRNEITAAEELYHAQRIPFINTTTVSIEEIATTIMQKMQLKHCKL